MSTAAISIVWTHAASVSSDLSPRRQQTTTRKFLVLMALADRADADRRCQVRPADIAKELGFSKDTVKRYLSLLETYGYVKVYRRIPPYGHNVPGWRKAIGDKNTIEAKYGCERVVWGWWAHGGGPVHYVGKELRVLKGVNTYHIAFNRVVYEILEKQA
jgi:Helix-turn-helix domain